MIMKNSKILLSILLLGSVANANPRLFDSTVFECPTNAPRQTIQGYNEASKTVRPSRFDIATQSIIFKLDDNRYISDPRAISQELARRGADAKSACLVRETDISGKVGKYMKFAAASYQEDPRISETKKGEDDWVVVGREVADLTPKGAEGKLTTRQQIIKEYGQDKIRTFKSDSQEAGFVTYESAKTKGDRDKLIFSIHGTATTQDIFTDLNGLGTGRSKLFPEISGHKGFFSYYDSYQKDMWNNALSLVDSQGKKLEDVDMVFNGHSLGGAQAQIGAYHAKKLSAPNARVDVFTYHSPAPFNATSAKIVEKVWEDTSGGRITRVEKEGDLVSNVGPNGIFYNHVGTQYLINSSERRTGLGWLWNNLKNLGENHFLINTENDFADRKKTIQTNERSRSADRLRKIEEKIAKPAAPQLEKVEVPSKGWFPGWSRSKSVEPVKAAAPQTEKVSPEIQIPEVPSKGWFSSWGRSKSVEPVRTAAPRT